MAKKCAWYQKGKRTDMYEELSADDHDIFEDLPTTFLHEESASQEDDDNPGDGAMYAEGDDMDVEGDERFDADFYALGLDDVEEVYHLIPIPDPPVEIGAPGPGPSTLASSSSRSRSASQSSSSSSSRPSRSTSITIDGNEERIIEEHPTAGKVIRMDDNLHEQWRRQFGGKDLDGDIPMDDSNIEGNRFAPFASELDWRVASWAVQDDIGHKSFDRLLSIPGVCYQTFDPETVLTVSHRLERNWVLLTKIFENSTKSWTQIYPIVRENGKSLNYRSKTPMRPTLSSIVIPSTLSRASFQIPPMPTTWSTSPRSSSPMWSRRRLGTGFTTTSGQVNGAMRCR
jgi:hypothetical protein